MWLKKKYTEKLRFHSANNIDNYNRAGSGRKVKEKKKKNPKETTEQVKTRIINVFLESLLFRTFPSLGVTVRLTSLACPPTLCWSLDLLWGQLRFCSCPSSVCSCHQCPQLSQLVHFLFFPPAIFFLKKYFLFIYFY